MTTTISEAISSILVDDSKIWISHEFIISTFNDRGEEDANLFMAPDVIHQFLTVPTLRGGGEEVPLVLACKDGVLRIVEGEEEVIIFIQIESVFPFIVDSFYQV